MLRNDSAAAMKPVDKENAMSGQMVAQGGRDHNRKETGFRVQGTGYRGRRDKGTGEKRG